MEPLGTISKYYPFIDEETKSILNSLMDESSSYYDFVQRLCNVVLENEVPVDLAYIAAGQAWWCRIQERIDQIQEKYNDIPIIRPWGYTHASIEFDQARFHDAVVLEIDEAIDTSLEDWIETDLHLLHVFFHWPGHGDIPSYCEPLEKAKSLVNRNPILKCFEPLIYAFEGWVTAREGDMDGSVYVFQRGQELSEKFDDLSYKYLNMLGEALALRTSRIQDSIARFEELYALTQDLGVPYLEAEVLHDSSVSFELAGEYDLAISSVRENLKTLDLVDEPHVLVSRIHATLGDGQAALEEINRLFDYRKETLQLPIYYIMKPWSLALLNRIDEAEHSLEKVYSLVVKSGQEVHLGRYYHVAGVVELKRGVFPAALDFLEKALEVAERVPRGINKNLALLDLARVEIALSDQAKDETKGAVPGKWLSTLEKYSKDHDLLGIRMYAALLVSEFYQKHNQLRDAHATLADALEITDSPGVTTLRKRITDQIQELSRLMKDKELVS
ncbi:MAG: tetratricopeptide repeat protein [Candidatus Thorarchaeota archaeon]